MSVKTVLPHLLLSRVEHIFASKPGYELAANVVRRLEVRDLAAGMERDVFRQSPGKQPVHEATGKALSMVPAVLGGFRAGDIVLHASDIKCMAESGIIETILNYCRGVFKVHKATVSHSGIIARDHDGELKVFEMISSSSPQELEGLLTPEQKKHHGSFLFKGPIANFFDLGADDLSTRSVVMRPRDAKAASQAAARAVSFCDAQLKIVDGKAVETHPWFGPDMFGYVHGGEMVKPVVDRQGGVCSTYVDKCANERYKPGPILPTTPEHFMLHPALEKVGDRQIVSARAYGSTSPEGIAIATAPAAPLLVKSQVRQSNS